MKLKKILSSVIAAAMVLSTMSFNALAAEEVLTGNVELTGTMVVEEDTVLDLNGYTLSGTSDVATLIYVKNNATLTVRDSGVEKGKIISGTPTVGSTTDYTTIKAENATVVVDGAVIEGANGVNAKYGATAINASLSEIVVSNGAVIKGGDAVKDGITPENYESFYKYQGEAGDAIYAWNTDVTISDSEIYGGNGIATDGTYKDDYISGGANFAEGGCALAITRPETDVLVTNSVLKGGNSDLYNAESAIDLTFSARLTIVDSTVTGGSSYNQNTSHGIAGSAIETGNQDGDVANVINISGSTLTGGNSDKSYIGCAISTGNGSVDVVADNSTLATGEGRGTKSSSATIYANNENVTISLKDSTLKAADGMNIVNVKKTETIKAEGKLTVEGAGLEEIVIVPTGDGVIVEGSDEATIAVAKIVETYYATFDEAIEAAVDGDEIVLLSDTAVSLINRPNGPTLTSAVTINLGGKTLTLNKDNLFKADITFKNGTIISNENLGTAPIWTGYGTGDVDVTLENVVYNAENLGGMAIINVEDPGAIITIKNSEINAKNFTYVNGSVIYSNGATVDIDDSTITADNIGVGLNYVRGSLNNTNMLITNSRYGILGMEDVKLTIEGNSEVKIVDSEEYDIAYMLTAGLPVYTGSVDVVAPAKLMFDTQMEGSKVTGETSVAKANTINVVFKNNDEDTDSTTTQYDIYLVGANGEKIYELASADLTFVNTSEQANGAAIPYKVTGKNDIAVSKNGDNNYLFNFDGYTKWQDTDSEILIGQVTFTGYGALDFKVDKEAKNEKDEYSNVANATKLINNIVDTFTIDGTVAKLVVNEDIDGDGEYVGVIDDTNEVATNNLTINVDFNNAVEKNIDDYQDMTVTVSGGDLADDIIINLGDADKDETLTFDDKTNAKYTVDASVDNKYVITVEDVLSVNNTYTVTVTGAGYRTVSYDVHMTDDKELTFWNNVMDAPKVVEKDNADSAKTVTFLAGDIVKDDNINIYDLSAVVSYFATKTTTTGYDEKAQYDLNRDGMIDSKDVAYVLVSWGK